jgi:hypothetical protein
MAFRHTYGLLSRPLAYLLLTVLVVGQCCLVFSEALADDGHHGHQAHVMSLDGKALPTMSAVAQNDPCCDEIPVLVSRTSLLKPIEVAVVVAHTATPPMLAYQLPATTRAPPLAPPAQQTHIRLQIFLI